MRRAANVSDYRALAKARLPHFLFEYLDGGSYDEVTLRRNVDDLQASRAAPARAPRRLGIDLSTELFGQQLGAAGRPRPGRLAGPVCAARRGPGGASGRGAAGVPFTLSTRQRLPDRGGRRELEPPFWFQLYIVRDRGFVARPDRAAPRRGGLQRLLLTVDLAGARASRYRDIVRPVRRQPDCERAAASDWPGPTGAGTSALRGRPHSLGNLEPLLGKDAPLDDFRPGSQPISTPSVTWKDVDWVREQWTGPLIIKGILDPEDARERGRKRRRRHRRVQPRRPPARRRRLDRPRLAARSPRRSGARLTVLVDGGVRSGLDVVRMLALGADFVLLGRAWAYALAGGGRRASRMCSRLIEAEMRVAMALTGCTTIGEINGVDHRPG